MMATTESTFDCFYAPRDPFYRGPGLPITRLPIGDPKVPGSVTKIKDFERYMRAFELLILAKPADVDRRRQEIKQRARKFLGSLHRNRPYYPGGTQYESMAWFVLAIDFLRSYPDFNTMDHWEGSLAGL